MKEYLQALRPLDSLMFTLAFIVSVVLCAKVRTSSYSADVLSPSLLPALISVMLLYGGGNIISCYFDQSSDLTSSREKQHRALLWSGLTLGAALLLSLFGGLRFFSALLLSGVLLVICGKYSKTLGIFRCFCAALAGSTVFLLGPLFTGAAGLNWLFLPLAFLFITTREMVKDIEDTESGSEAGALTIPIRFGVKTAFAVADICGALGLFLSAIYHTMNIFSPLFLTFLSFAILLYAIGNIFVFMSEAHTFRRYIEMVMLFLLLGALP